MLKVKAHDIYIYTYYNIHIHSWMAKHKTHTSSRLLGLPNLSNRQCPEVKDNSQPGLVAWLRQFIHSSLEGS